MLLFLCGLDFLEGVSDRPHGDAIVVIIKVADNDFAGPLIRIVLLVGLAVLIAFHCECLAATCLPVRKDGGVEAVHHFLDEAWHLQTLEDILLRVLTVQNLVKCVVLARVVVLLIQSYLILLTVDVEQLRRVPSLLLLRQHWAHAHRDSNI